MNLYLISQDQNQDYDTYDSAVVAANSEDEARNIHPGGAWEGYSLRTWCESPSDAKVTFLCSGYNGKAGVVLASFNAG